VYAAVQPPNAWWTAHWMAEAWLENTGGKSSKGRKQEAAILACLLRDLIGSPTHSLQLLPPPVLAWNGRTVQRLAEAAYNDRLPDGTLDPSRLAIIADALLDAGAGLDAEELLSHLRSEGPHYRGCWGVDLVLGRS
jgi:hypothetical protein